MAGRGAAVQFELAGSEMQASMQSEVTSMPGLTPALQRLATKDLGDAQAESMQPPRGVAVAEPESASAAATASTAGPHLEEAPSKAIASAGVPTSPPTAASVAKAEVVIAHASPSAVGSSPQLAGTGDAQQAATTPEPPPRAAATAQPTPPLSAIPKGSKAPPKLRHAATARGVSALTSARSNSKVPPKLSSRSKSMRWARGLMGKGKG